MLVGPVANIPLLKGPPIITDIFFSSQNDNNSFSYFCSSRVYLPASKIQSKLTNDANFLQTFQSFTAIPIALIVPLDLRFSSSR